MHMLQCARYHMDFHGGPVVKNPPANAEDPGSIPGSGRSPGRGNDNPPQCFCLESPMDRGVYMAKSMGLQKSPTWLSN